MTARSAARLPIRARVVDITATGVVVDLGGGREAFVRRHDLLWGDRCDPRRLSGGYVEGLLVADERQPSRTIVSPRALALRRARRAMARRRRVSGTAIRANRGGLVLEVLGLRAFLPRSLMDRGDARRYKHLVGASWSGYVVGVRRRELILSSRRGSPV